MEKRGRPRISDEVKRDRRLAKLEQETKDLRKKYRVAVRELNKAEIEQTFASSVASSKEMFRITPYKSGGMSEATAVMVASDWHCEETVLPEEVNGLNEYSLAISRERASKYFQRGLRLVNVFNKDIKINTLVLALLGDFFSGSIHEELAEENSLAPADAAALALEYLEGGIRFLLKNSTLKIVVPCLPGNHGRMTQKNRTANEAGNSLERFMYINLAERFSNEKRVKFIIPRAKHIYMNVYGFTIRFMHGHTVRYAGGVGGISIPLNKAIPQWDKLIPADLTVLGHFHQFLDGGRWLVNGSLIGYNTFALDNKFGYEVPKQAFFLVDKKRGKTVVAPILFS